MQLGRALGALCLIVALGALTVLFLAPPLPCAPQACTASNSGAKVSLNPPLPCVPQPCNASISSAKVTATPIAPEPLPAHVLDVVHTRWHTSPPGGEAGVANLQRLLGLLAVLPGVAGRERLLNIDIGGNVGQTSARLLREIVARRPRDFVLLTFEPMRAYNRIVARATAENWTALYRFAVFQCAVGVAPGNTTFYYDSETSEQSSQDQEAAGANAKYTAQVPIVTLDQLFYGTGLPATIVRTGSVDIARVRAADVYFLKIDTEGYDPDVLQGAARMLRERRARFVEFEYNGKWFSRGRNRTLRQVVQWLGQQGDYECFFISARHLHPLGGEWWHDAQETRGWSNVFCGWRGDRYLYWLARRFDGQDFDQLTPTDMVEFRAISDQ